MPDAYTNANADSDANAYSHEYANADGSTDAVPNVFAADLGRLRQRFQRLRSSMARITLLWTS